MSRLHARALALASVCAGLLWSAPAAAFDFSGEKTIFARFQDQSQVRLGQVVFGPAAPTPAGAQAQVRFQVKLNTAVMTDHCLSMREFKCLQGGSEITCVVPYPYAHPGTVGPGQLAWLEHNLLFLFKRPADFGAKLWNGVIFKFTETDTALVGRPQAVDLNAISAPPEWPNEPPYAEFDRTDFPVGARWLVELRIE
jgi:hypothetical protein